MAKITITVPGWKCERCDHEWKPRIEAVPKQCPRCKSPYWNTPRKAKTLLDPAYARQDAACLATIEKRPPYVILARLPGAEFCNEAVQVGGANRLLPCCLVKGHQGEHRHDEGKVEK